MAMRFGSRCDECSAPYWRGGGCAGYCKRCEVAWDTNALQSELDRCQRNGCLSLLDRTSPLLALVVCFACGTDDIATMTMRESAFEIMLITHPLAPCAFTPLCNAVVPASVDSCGSCFRMSLLQYLITFFCARDQRKCDTHLS